MVVINSFQLISFQLSALPEIAYSYYMISSYKNLIVWQKSMELVIEVYKLTDAFPKTEMFGLVSQMRRCAVSIPSNIAEGKQRGTRKEYRQFTMIAFGSGAELETQIEISKRLGFCEKEDYIKVDELLGEILRMLNKLRHSLDN
ncbi:MAG: S23 ribosomal protein family protein [Candidatus Moranbacteria bacterium GW2011_GWE1_49_15]|nr:MAG: S23 ribosomal protein family protein [Candidatus Moranbacteria bacterium GW2011_GWE1_49_15]